MVPAISYHCNAVPVIGGAISRTAFRCIEEFVETRNNQLQQQ